MNADANETPFVFMGPAHLTVIALAIFVCVLLPLLIRCSRSQKTATIIRWTLAFILLGAEWASCIYILQSEGLPYFLQNALPLHACGIAVYVTALMLLTQNQVLFEISYFWGFAGTTQAILTPVVQTGFGIEFLYFFLVHGSILAGVCAAVFGLKMRPRLKGLWITYALSWAMVPVIGGVNLLLDANYMYLCQRPAGHSPFYFLPWPWYIPFLGVLALVLFFLLWLPFRGKLNPVNRRRILY